MEQGITEQLKFLSAVFISGILFGFLYDVLRAKRKLFKTTGFSVNFEDILFCVICGSTLLVVIFYFNSAKIRISAFLDAGAGVLLYFYILKNKMVKFLVRTAIFTEKIVAGVLKVILFPVKIIIRLFKKPVCIIYWHVGSKMKKIKSILKVNLHKLGEKARLFNLFIKKR